MKNPYSMMLKLLVISLFIVGGVGALHKTAMTMESEGGLQSGAGPLPMNMEQDKKPSSTDSKRVDDRNGLGIPEATREDPETATTQRMNPIYDKFVLLGTVVGSEDYALAIIEDKARRSQKVYKIGDSISGGVITDIQRERVIIRLRGKEFIFKMGGGSVGSGKEDMRPKSVEERTFVTVSSQDMQEALDALAQPTSRARLARRSPDLDSLNGGLQLSSIEPGSIFEEMGFKEGDVIEEVNGNPIKDPYNAVAMYNLMKTVLPGDMLDASGLDLRGFMNGTYSQMDMLLRMQKLFYIFGKNKGAMLTFTVKRGGKGR